MLVNLARSWINIYHTFLKIILVPTLNVEVITNTLQLHRDASTLPKSGVDKRKPFLLTDNEYYTI